MPFTYARVPKALLGEFLLRKSRYWDAEGRVDRLLAELTQPASEEEILNAISLVVPEADFHFVVKEDFIASSVTDTDSAGVISDFEALETYLGSTAEFVRIAPDFDWLVHGDLIVLRPSAFEGDGYDDYGTDADVMGEYDPPPIRPLISRIAITNFKGIGERVEIDLKPITLLFGPNSAGKSTILHALHYAREIFERHNLDADQTAAGGKFVDLGGFRNFVHCRRLDARVTLEFDIDLAERELPTYVTPGGVHPVQEYELADVSAAVNLASVRTSIGFSETLNEVYVAEYAVAINGEPFAVIRCSPDRRTIRLENINYRHPTLPINDLFRAIADFAEGEGQENRPIVFSLFELEGQTDALPVFGKALRLATLADQAFVEAATKEVLDSVVVALDAMTAVFSQLVVGCGEVVRNALIAMTYLGPIREIPGRQHYAPKTPDPSRWSSGLAALDFLLTCPDLHVDLVSEWMRQRLSTGYRVERRQSMKIDMASPAMHALLSGRAFEDVEMVRIHWAELPKVSEVFLVAETNNLDLAPCEVGIGLSQLLPVVVAGMIESDSLAMIEQPELHVHPRIQAEMGDLFVEAALFRSKQFILETHSEHLVLRILRRIRETTEKELPTDFPILKPADVAIHYVEQIRGEAQVTNLQIDETGEFRDPWPHGFFEERGKELFGS